MPSGEPEPHSFIVKIWRNRENNEDGAEQHRWRGHITHVPGGERRYLDRLEEILEFIARFLPEEAAPPRPSRWRALLARWRKRR